VIRPAPPEPGAPMGVAGARPRRAAVAFVFVTVMLDMLALGLIVPVLPQLVLGFVGGDTAAAARMVGWFGTVWALMQFAVSPAVGVLSDRVGRRPVILLSNLGLGLDYLVMALAPSLGWLFVGRVVSGITAASISTAGAYIADVTAPEKRAAAFGFLGTAFGIGFVLGPAAGGMLGQIDARLPFWVAGALSLVNAGYGFFVLPESLPPERRSCFDWRRANPVAALTLLRRHAELTGLAAANFLGYVAHDALPSTFVLYAGYRYHWDQATLGLTLAAVGVSSVIVQATLIQPLVTALGERLALVLGLFAGAAGFAIYGLAPTGPIFWLGVPVLAFWGLAGAASQSLMTKQVEPNEQGQLQGALSSARGIAGLIGPGLFAVTFAFFIGRGALPGAPFLLAAALVFLSIFVAWRATRPVS
jgi:DHA1 family tetracycline resistance protein-like MFS transporter